MLTEIRPGSVTLGVFHLAEPQDLTDPIKTLMLVGILRDAMERSERVKWSTVADPPVDLVRLMEHLPPPQGRGAQLDIWRSRHMYGALYFRRGPGFVAIRERRSGWPGSVTTLASENALSCWETLREPTDHRCHVCEQLEADHLVLRIDGIATRLPYRLRFPPTPFLAI